VAVAAVAFGDLVLLVEYVGLPVVVVVVPVFPRLQALHEDFVDSPVLWNS
jgi:hypothetical protein